MLSVTETATRAESTTTTNPTRTALFGKMIHKAEATHSSVVYYQTGQISPSATQAPPPPPPSSPEHK